MFVGCIRKYLILSDVYVCGLHKKAFDFIGCVCLWVA